MTLQYPLKILNCRAMFVAFLLLVHWCGNLAICGIFPQTFIRNMWRQFMSLKTQFRIFCGHFLIIFFYTIPFIDNCRFPLSWVESTKLVAMSLPCFPFKAVSKCLLLFYLYRPQWLVGGALACQAQGCRFGPQPRTPALLGARHHSTSLTCAVFCKGQVAGTICWHFSTCWSCSPTLWHLW